MGLKIGSVSLAVLALAGLSGPALANDTQGWYLGLGVGYDHMTPLHVNTPKTPTSTSFLHQADAAMVAGSFGYKWASNLRMEFEVGYESHNIRSDAPFVSGILTGPDQLRSALVNFIYDWNLGSNWSVSVGGGGGLAQQSLDVRSSLFPTLAVVRDNRPAFAWQGIVGLNYEFDPGAEVFVDYRYRSVLSDRGYMSDFAAFNPLHVSPSHENVAMLGIRWFVDQTPLPLPW